MTSTSSRTIALTGATKGLGRALVDRFVEAGHTVFGCGRSGEAIEELAASHPLPHAFETVDVSDHGQVEAWARTILETAGSPDLLINNAAVINRNARLWEVSAEEMAMVLAVNIGGPANAIRAFVPAMIERGRGVIVNLSSGWGRSTAPEVGPYCATKWAIEGMTGSLAQELPRGLAAVAVNPGVIDTEMLRSCWGEDAGAYRGPEEWSRRAAPFLLGLDAGDNGAALTAP